MIVIDNGDAIRGIAEVASKLDFIVNGYVGTTATQLADGQLGTSEGDLYASGANATVVTSITIVNTDSSARTFTLYLKPSGGTSRAISPVSLDLGIGHSFYTDGQRIAVMDATGQVLCGWVVDGTPVDGEVNQPISSNWAFDHAALAAAHGAVSAATASKIVIRDASARAKFAAPNAAGDALIKGTALTITEMPVNMKLSTIAFIIDGGGAEIADGLHGDLEIPFGCTINQVTMLADQSGSIIVDIWKQAYADYPPEDAQSITASAPPTITTAVKSQDSTLTGWTTAITAGDTLRFNVDSCTDIERVTISLKVTKT